MKIYIDFETTSACSLKDCGTWAYSKHPSTDVVCMAYAIDDEPIGIWAPNSKGNFPHLRANIAAFNRCHIEAHNAYFERCIWENIMVPRYGFPKIPAEKWSCSMALCASKGLPMALADVAEVLKLPQRKDTRGKLLLYKINKPIPGKLTSEETEILYEYCKQDVAVEREITRRIGAISPTEQAVWQIDQLVNFTGIKLDRDLAEKALKIVEEYTKELETEIPALTGGALTSTRQRDKTIVWLQKNGLPKLESVDKENVANALKTTTLSKSVRRVLEIRQQVSKTSTAKIQTMLNSADAGDSRIRGCFQYHGASTGRWSGRLVQFQNMPRGSIKDVDTCIDLIRMGDVELLKMSYDDVMGAVSSCLRGLLIPEKGYSFVASDYAAIETRVLFWLAGETEGVKKLKEDRDIYIDMAESIYRVKGLDKKDPRRQLGKTAILGLGYGMGAKKFLDTCAKQNIKVSEDLAEEAVRTYRSKYLSVVQFWYAVEKAAREAVAQKRTVELRNKIKFEYNGSGALRLILPSGRKILYHEPEIKYDDKQRPRLSFMGVNSLTRRWSREDTYGGKLVENIVQAVSRDLLAEAMYSVVQKGIKIAIHVHDEIVIETAQPEKDEKFLVKVMSTPPRWATGLPLKAEAWVGKRYRK